MSRLAALAALACTVTLAAGASAGGPVLRETCLAAGDGATPVAFRASDGARVAGALFGDGRLGVVLAHQWGSDLCEWRDLALELAQDGRRVLAIDLRGYGSTPYGGPAPGRYDRDVLGAAAELRRRGATRVVAIGASMGGTAALVAAATRGARIDGVVALSAPAVFQRLDARRAVARLRVPARFVAARRDRSFAADARSLARVARTRDKAVLLVPGGAHGSSLLDADARVRPLVLALLDRVAAG